MLDAGSNLRPRVLGPSGLRVSELCLGTMTFGTAWGWGADEATCRQIYDAYRTAGGNFVDTANVYTNGESEEIVGRLIAGERDEVVLASKFTMPTARDANASGSHRKSLRRSLEASLRRLNTDHLDLLWVHAWDRTTPIDETLRALDDLVRSGTVLAIGVSNTPAWVVARADAIADGRGWSRFCAVQLEYSLAARTAERELLPMADALGLAVLAYGPLARGKLAGKPPAVDAPPMPARLAAIVDVTAKLAAALGVTPARVAIAWLLQRGVIPVIGATKLAQAQDNLAANQVVLAPEQLAELDVASAVSLGYPHEFLRERAQVIGRSE